MFFIDFDMEIAQESNTDDHICKLSKLAHFDARSIS